MEKFNTGEGKLFKTQCGAVVKSDPSMDGIGGWLPKGSFYVRVIRSDAVGRYRIGLSFYVRSLDGELNRPGEGHPLRLIQEIPP